MRLLMIALRTLAAVSASSVAVAGASNAGASYATIVPVGATGNGKSETANSILAKPAFKVNRGLQSETRCIQHETVVHEGMTYRVFDTPGFFDTSLSQEQVEGRIAPLASKSEHGVDAFLLTLAYGRLSQESSQSYEAFKSMFGRAALRHAIPVFTKCGDLMEEDVVGELKKMCSAEPESKMCVILSEVDMQKTVAFGELTPHRREHDRARLLSKVQDLIAQNGGRKYDHAAFEKVRARRAQLKARIDQLPSDFQEVLLQLLEQVSNGQASEAALKGKLEEKEQEHQNRVRAEEERRRAEEEQRTCEREEQERRHRRELEEQRRRAEEEQRRREQEEQERRLQRELDEQRRRAEEEQRRREWEEQERRYQRELEEAERRHAREQEAQERQLRQIIDVLLLGVVIGVLAMGVFLQIVEVRLRACTPTQ